MLATILASIWIIPAASAAAGAVVTLLFGGDWTLALISAATLGAAVLAYRIFGLKGALGLVALGALIFTDRRGVRRGAAQQAEREKADAERALEKASRARADADRYNADVGRLRDDDGFRRD